MLDFLKSNWTYLLTGFCTLVSIFLLLKKTPIKSIIKLLEMLPKLISSAEKFRNTDGSVKHDAVVNMFNDIAESQHLTKYLKYINTDAFIEDILKSPQATIYKEEGDKSEKESQSKN